MAKEFVVQTRVHSLLSEQSFVSAALHEAAVIQNQDEIGIADSAKTMRNHKCSPAFEQKRQRFLESRLGDGVDGTGGFIENNDAWIGKQSASEANDLTLTQGQSGAAFAN